MLVWIPRGTTVTGGLASWIGFLEVLTESLADHGRSSRKNCQQHRVILDGHFKKSSINGNIVYMRFDV